MNSKALRYSYRVAWLLLVTASAVALTDYLADPHSQCMSGAMEFALLACAWLAAVVAWRQQRPHLLRWSAGLTWLVVILEVFFVSLVRNAYFSCPLPPPSHAELAYDAARDAIHRGDLGKVRQLIAAGLDPSYLPSSDCPGYDCTANDERLLAIAVEQGNPEMVQLLIDHGAHAEGSLFTGPSQLPAAVAKRNLAVARILLQHHANPNPGGDDTPLALAASQGDTAMVTLLLQFGAKVNDKQGDSPALIGAINAKNAGMAKFLIDHGASVNGRSWGGAVDGGETMLHMARRLDSISVAKVLKAGGARD